MVRTRDVLFVSLLGAASASGQGSVWVVDKSGGGDFTTPLAAIAAASTGDTLLIRSGSYGGEALIISKGLALVAEEGAEVLVGGGVTCGALDGGLVVMNLPAGERVLVRGIDFDWINLSGNLGSIWIEDAEVGNVCPDHAIIANHCGSVILTRSTFRGGDFPLSYATLPPARGLSATSASIYALASTFSGGKGYEGADGPGSTGDAGTGANGARVSDVFFFCGGCTLTGGTGGDGESELAPCAAPGDGGDALHLTGPLPSDVRFLDSTFAGGAAGIDPTSAPVCPPAPASDGAAWSGAPGTVASLGTAGFLALSATSPVREGAFLTVEVDGPPDVLSFVAFGTALDPLFIEGLFGALQVAPPYTIRVLGATDASGHAQLTVPVGFLPPGWEAFQFFGQAAYLSGSGAIVLGGATWVTVLDETL